MGAGEKLLRRVALKCADMVRQLSYHRAINQRKEYLTLNFWIYMYNNTIDMAVLDWVHLFGNDKDDLHWKNIVNNIDEFRNDLFTELEVTKETWITYWKSIREYRNKDVAHIEVRPISNIPEMSLAVKAVCFYYSHILLELEKYGDYSKWPKNLFDYYERSFEQSMDISLIALYATSNFKEKVY